MQTQIADCCYISNYFKKKNRKKIVFKFFLIFFVFILLIYLLISFISKKVNPVIISFSEATISKVLTDSCNEAISLCMGQINYDDLVEIKYNDDKSISNITANTEKINKIANFLAQHTQNEIDKASNVGLEIPIGTLSGIVFLIGKGNKINFNINPVGNVMCEFFTEFISAGINQTSHKIYVSIESVCFLTLPFSTTKIKKNISFLIAECVIIGKIPNVYFNNSSIENLK